MQWVGSQDSLEGFDTKQERAFCKILREAREANNVQVLIQLPVKMVDAQPLAVQEVAMSSISNVTSSIIKPTITGHFELKHNII